MDLGDIMAQEYVAMSNKEKGIIAISTNVFETIAKICVDEQKDVVLVDSSFMKNAILCKLIDEKLVLQLQVKVHYNAKVNDVCSKLQTRIYDNIKHMSDCVADTIVINVNGFTF